MTPKEKAIELVEKYRTIIRKSDVYDHLSYRFVYLSKQCALIAVDEIMGSIDAEDHVILYNYWLKVKKEIENL